MRIDDDVYLWPGEPEVRTPRMTAGERSLLSGIGDRQARAVEDFLAEHGVDLRGSLSREEDWTPEPGQPIEFVTPDGIRRGGVFREFQSDGDALVQIDEGEFNLVARRYLERPREEVKAEKLASLRTALNGSGGFGSLTATRDLLPMGSGGTDYALTLQYSGPKPTETDVRAFVAMHYPEAQVLDGDDTHPNRLGLVLHFPLGRQASLPVESPSHYMDDQLSRPGAGGSLKDGTGEIGQTSSVSRAGAPEDTSPEVVVEASFNRLAEFNPGADFIETSFSSDIDGARLEFSIVDRKGHLDPSTPRDGFVELRNRQIYAGLLTARGEVPASKFLRVSSPYESGTGPLTSREDDPGGFQDGDYAIKASESPASSEEDGEVREHLGGPGLQVAKKEGLRRLAQLGVQLGDRYRFLSDSSDSDDKPVPAGTTLTVEQTDVGRFGDVILSDGSSQYVFEPKRIEQLYMSDVLEMGTSSGADPTEKAKAAGADAYNRGFRQATKVQELAQVEFPNDPSMQQAFVDGYMEAARVDAASKLTAATERRAVDQKTKDYYEEFYGSEYAKMLTRDVPRKGSEESQEKDAVRANMLDAMKTAWAHYGHGEPTPAQVFRVARILRVGHQKIAIPLPGAPTVRGLNPFSKRKPRSQGSPSNPQEPGTSNPEVSLLLHSALQNPQVRAQVDRLVIDTLAKSPEALNSIPGSAYLTMVQAAVGAMSPEVKQNLIQMVQPGADFQPGMKHKLTAPLQKLKEWWGGKVTTPQAPQSETPPSSGFSDEPAFAQTPGLGVGPESPAEVQQDFPPAAQTPDQAPSLPQQSETPFAPLLDEANQSMIPPGQSQRPQTRPRVGSSVSVPPGVKIYEGNMERPTKNKAIVAGTVLQVSEDLALVRTENGKVIGAKLDDLQSRQARGKTADAPADAFAGRRQPAKNQLRFKLDKVFRRGDYMHLVVLWDSDDMADIGIPNLKHQVISFVKQKASHKDFYDLGFIGRPRLLMLDADVGMAEVKVRSSETRSVVPEYMTDSKGEHSEPYA